MTDQNNAHAHAIANATGWLASIHEMVAKLNGAVESDTGDGQDEAREEIEESPLSIRIRDDWRNPGSDEREPGEYEILLTTGGPALRIVGELDGYYQPSTASLQWQDWGTPWTEHATSFDDDKALMAFANVFWFGE